MQMQVGAGMRWLHLSVLLSISFFGCRDHLIR